jgi:hypothetical protein
MEKVMNTSKTPRTQKLLIVSLFAAFAAQTFTSQAAETVSDTQTRVRSVLEGTHVVTSDLRISSTPARSADIQENARRILSGSKSFTPKTGGGTIEEASAAKSVGSNGHSSSEAQTLTQRVVMGRSGS